MTVKVDIPIRLEVGADVLRGDASRELAARVAEVVTRNLAFMTAELATDGHHGTPAFGEPKLHWTGPGLHALSASDRARSGGRLLDAVRKACDRFAAASRSARLDPSGDWRVERLEFVAAFDRVLALVDAFAWNRADELRVRYADHGNAEVHGVAWIVTVQRPVSWNRVYGAVNAERRRDLGDETLFGYFWDAARTEELRGIDPRHLHDLPRLEHEEMTAPGSGAGTALWQLAAGTRVIFVAAAHPEVEAEAYVEFGRAVTVEVALHEAITATNGVLDAERLQQVYQLGDQAVLDLLQHDPDAQLAVWVLPFALKRPLSSGPLRALLIDQAAALRAPASPLEQVRPLGPAARADLPRDVTDPGLALARGKPAPPDHIGSYDRWQPGWAGVYLRPVLDRDQLHARAGYAHEAPQFEDEAARVTAMLDLRNGLLSAARHDAIWTWTARWLNARPEAFDLLLAAIDRRGALGRLFESWLEEKLYPSRLRILVRLCLRTRYARHPKVQALIAAVERWEVEHSSHDYDVATQQIRLFHDDAAHHRITAAGAGSDPRAGVVAEVNSYYSKETKIRKLSKAALAQLAEPVQRTAGALVGAMICEGNDGMTADEVLAQATEEVSRKVKFTDADYEVAPLRLSVRVLRLEHRASAGVTDVVVHWVPVRKIGDEHWTPTGKAVAGPPAQFEAVLTSYHVEHMMDWVVTPIVLGGAIMLTGGAALAAGVGVGELVGFILFSELMYVIANRHEGVTLNGFLMAAWMGEIEALGFKGVSGAIGLAGEVGGALFTRIALRLGTEAGVEAVTIGVLRTQATKWILFLLRGAVTGLETGSGAVLGLVAKDLLMMSRCHGWSSADEYWQQFKIGALVGVALELVAAPLLAPILRPLLDKAKTILEVVKVLRRSGKTLREIVGVLRAGADAMEHALGRTLRNPAVTGKLTRSFRDRLLDVLRTWGREYETRAYKNLIALLDEKLGERASKTLLQLLDRQSEHELDELLGRIHGSKHIDLADLLDLLADLDDAQLARLLGNGGVARLAESPALLALLRRTPQSGWRLLAEVFDGAVGDCDAYVARFAHAGTRHLDPVIDLLLRRGRLIPHDALADVVLELGNDPIAAARLLDALGGLDEQLVAALVRRGQLRALAAATRLLELWSTRPRAALDLLVAVRDDVAAAERFLAQAQAVSSPELASRIAALRARTELIIASEQRVGTLVSTGTFRHSAFHGTSSDVLGGLEITHGQIVPAADLPSFGVHVTTGEGSTFSGRAGPKTFISVGIGETGLGTGAAYADAARTLGHYNIKLVPLSELEAEARRLKTIVENFEHPRAHDRFGDPVPRLSKAQFQEHLDKVDRELSRRAALPPDSPGRLGGAGAADNYPILLEFDPTNLHAVPRPDVSADQAGVLSGEASISARIDLPKRLQRAYAPAARVAELRVRLTAILGHGNFEVVALEGLDALPDAGVIGTTRQLTLGNLQGLEADFEQQQAAYLNAAMKKAQRRRPRP